jgi:hypothetical protein
MHYVITVEDSITYGRHLWTTSTMLETVFGIVHTFIVPETTNAQHEIIHTMLRRMMTMWHTHLSQDLSSNEIENPHVPDISTVHGLMVLLAVGNVLECSQIIDRRSYSQSGVHWNEHGEMAAARRQYRHLQVLFALRYVVHVGENAVLPRLLFKRSLVEFAAAVLVYKKQRVNKVEKVPGCTFAALEEKCQAVFRSNHPDLVPCLNRLVKEGVEYLYWRGPPITITQRTPEHAKLEEDKDFRDRPIFLESNHENGHPRMEVDRDEMQPGDVEMAAPGHAGAGPSGRNLRRRPSGELKRIIFNIHHFNFFLHSRFFSTAAQTATFALRAFTLIGHLRFHWRTIPVLYFLNKITFFCLTTRCFPKQTRIAST